MSVFHSEGDVYSPGVKHFTLQDYYECISLVLFFNSC